MKAQAVEKFSDSEKSNNRIPVEPVVISGKNLTVDQVVRVAR